mgnify:CR=1 FL=1
MREILHIEFDLEDYDFNNSSDLSDLEITSSINLVFQDKYAYATEQFVEDSILKITDQEYIPNDKDKLYFLPGVSVPRIKLKDLATTRGIKTTRKIKDAHAIFASRATLSKLTENTWRNFYKTEDVKAFIEAGKEYFDSYDYEKLTTALEFYTEDIITTSYQGVKVLEHEDIPFKITSNYENERFIVIKEENAEIFIALKNNQTGTIYDESKILAHVNGDNCVTIDHDMYTNLHDMFESSDTDNHILAMEIMANSNYIESLLYIEMLFMNHAHDMDRNEKNHVNFKSLLSYLDKEKGYMNTDLDKVMSSLRAKGVFTKDNIEKLLKYESEKHLSLSGSYTYFTVKSVSLKPEYLLEINSDLDFIIQEDYVPVIEEAPTFDNTTVDDQAAEEGTEEFIEYPEITNEEAEHNIKAQEEIDMIKNDKIIEEREADDMIVEQPKFDEYDL